jgi:hypothetical protein
MGITRCVGGHVDTVRWLVARFGLGAADVRARSNTALREICARGNHMMAAWVVDFFGLTAHDLAECASHDRLTAHWLADFRAGVKTTRLATS